MDLLRLLFKRSKGFYFLLALLSIINALMNTGLLWFVNNAMSGRPSFIPKKYEGPVFFCLILLSVICSRTFQGYLIRLTIQINFDFELNILRKLRQASFPDFLKLGKERVITAVSDVRSLVRLPEALMGAVNATITVLCCFAYLFHASWRGGTVLLCLILSLVIFYLLRNHSIKKDLNTVRDLQNHYYRYLDDLLNGFKEIRTDPFRSRNIYERFFLPNRSRSSELSRKANTRYMTNELIGTYSWYIIIGVALFVIPGFFDGSRAYLGSFLVTILYLVGPVTMLVSLIPTYTNMRIAFQRLSTFNQLIITGIPGNKTEEEISPACFECISFRDITYSYTDEMNNRAFSLGPLSLDIQKGEIIFITGGNGSGKSTFVNILTGLFSPASGSIYLNSVPVRAEDLPGKYNLISAVFASPHLFSENYNGFDLQPHNETLREWLQLLALEDKVRFANDTIDPNLSKGQQKRLAIILALLEDKPILVLDEWAADQDPAYRGFFYNELLPQLQAKGKTVIAVTHDDRFFHQCNRLIKFDYGKITEYENGYYAAQAPGTVPVYR